MPWPCLVPGIAVLACKACTVGKRERPEHTAASSPGPSVVSELRGAGETVSPTRRGLDVSLPVCGSAGPLGLRGPCTFLSEGQCWGQQYVGALRSGSLVEQRLSSGCRGQRCRLRVPSRGALSRCTEGPHGRQTHLLRCQIAQGRGFHSCRPHPARSTPGSTAPRASPGSRPPALSRWCVWPGQEEHVPRVPEALPQRGRSLFPRCCAAWPPPLGRVGPLPLELGLAPSSVLFRAGLPQAE